MFCVWVFVAQNICLLYLSLHAFLCSANFSGGIWNFRGETSPPDVSRINPGCVAQLVERWSSAGVRTLCYAQLAAKG